MSRVEIEVTGAKSLREENDLLRYALSEVAPHMDRLSKDNARLREALVGMIVYPNPTSADGSDSDAEYGERERAALQAAYAALEGTTTTARPRSEAERRAAEREEGGQA